VFAAANAIISGTTMAVKEIMKRQKDESIQDQRQELQSSSQLQDNNIFFLLGTQSFVMQHGRKLHN
jgi:hypothetical protein